MSASEAHALDAIAFQLLAALEDYDRLAGRLIAAWPDPYLYRELSDRVDRLRMHSSALPESRVLWVEVLIAHAELVHCLWRVQSNPGDEARAQIDAVRERHHGAIVAMHERCEWALQQRRPAA